MAATQYASIADFQALAVTPGALNTISVATQNQALLAASGLIDSVLRAKFTLPLVSFGQDIVQAVCDIAAYRLFSRRGFDPNTPGDAEILRRYQDAMAWLKAISEGVASPDIVDSSPGATEGSPRDEARVITSSMRGWSSRGQPGALPSGGGLGPFEDD